MKRRSTVSAETPLLETRSASAGQVIDEKRIALMPLSDGNPFVLARLAPGVAYTRRPEVLAAVRQRRHVRLHRRRRAGRQRVHARRLAQHGQRPPRGVRAARRRGAGVQGRNRDLRRAAGPHGRRDRQRHAEERHQQDQGRRLLPLPRRDARRRTTSSSSGPAGRRTGWTTSATASTPAARSCSASSTTAATRRSSSPRFEWLYDTFPEPGQFTVPTEAQRNGDFSALLSQGIVIYDPADRGAPRRRPRRAPAVPEQRHPVGPHQPDRPRDT